MKTRFTIILALLVLSIYHTTAQQTLNKSMLLNGVTREYIVYIPAVYDGTSSVPLMFNFHGLGHSANYQMTSVSNMRPVADTAGFIVVYPQGTLLNNGSTHWNVGTITAGSTADDLGFTEAMIDTLADNYNIDLTRVYSCGYSNGGYFSLELACQLGDRIAAIGSVGGTMSEETYNACNPRHPTPVVTIHGTDDNTVSYYGDIPINSKSLADVNTYWVNHNNANSSATITNLPNINTYDGSTVEYHEYNKGDNCTSVEHYKVLGGGHTWPGVSGNMDINADAVIWDFVSQYDINGLIVDCGATSINERVQATICDGMTYQFGTQTLSEAGEYTEVFESVSCCDSTVVLTLTVNPAYNESIQATICDGMTYQFGTQTLSEAGEYTEVFETVTGCDSTVVLTLTVNPAYNESIQATICDGMTYQFGAQTLSEAGEYTEVFETVTGCDSTVVLTLAVNPVYNESIQAAICDGMTYQFGTQTLSEAGEYTKVFETVTGCDSTVVLTLTVNPAYNESIQATICDGMTYQFGTQTLSEAGEYTEVFESVTGCDSTVVLTLAVNPAYSESIQATICDGMTYQFGTQTLSEAGEYTEVFETVTGCDSTVVLTLTVNPAYNESIQATICDGMTYQFGTQTLSEAGEYTEVFESVTGCDSTVVLTLTVNSAYNESIQATICDGMTYQFGTQTLSEAGEYTEVFESVTGCDSTVVLTIKVDQVEKPTITIKGDTLICNNEGVYDWYLNNILIEGAKDRIYIAHFSGDYQAIVTNENGCKSNLSDILKVIVTSVNDLSFTKNIKVYPNPTFDKINIEGLKRSNKTNIRLFDSMGRRLYSNKPILTTMEIDITGFASGIYHLVISQGNSKVDYKIIIK